MNMMFMNLLYQRIKDYEDKTCGLDRFFLNLSYAIVEFIAGGIFGSSAVLADSVHDLGMQSLLGSPPFGEYFQS